MESLLENICTKNIDKIIKKHTFTRENTIFVLTGAEPYIDLAKYSDHIVDKETFNIEGNLSTFTGEWFSKILSTLLKGISFQILSHQQFAYLCEYLAVDIFQDRIVIVNDNLRSLYKIDEADYLEKGDTKGDEVRPDEMPCYQAEQFKIGNSFYYSLKRFNDNFKKEALFTTKKEIVEASVITSNNVEVLDIISDPYAIDILINKCIETNNYRKNVYVKISKKNILSKDTNQTILEVNGLFAQFGGGVYYLQESAVQKEYIPTEETVQLLKQYWGKDAKFRNIMIYENPELSNHIVPVSQGLLVDTIINEYKNGCNGIMPRDIFITAPTGAGKSLIFQLPAFYAASRGDVTIVVSPLKALMTDQVEALHTDHNFNRVEFLNSDLTLIDRDKIIDSCKKGDIDILYLSPELLLSYDIHYFIGDRNLGLLIIDEAHLITTWGRDFRVDYWFLGNHINKMRKYNNYMFPMVALTATAVYGGVNDMVFDSINSLNMHDPHKFIGNVRRDNIEFVIDTHDDYLSGSYEQNKFEETTNFIKGIHKLGMKCIVYAPYKRHINRLKEKCDEIEPNIVVSYHGEMLPDEQKFAYQTFKSNNHKVMICTKAFGMGVDIPDIQVVYHHAPSGLLPDYVQEIGRAARKTDIQGFAALTFSNTDLRYSKQLFGISSLKTFQLKEVLKKIIRNFNNNGKKRNMLIAANDFAYIFDNGDVDQKVATALMMIEKDYLIKTRFNVLIARPKKLFTTVYARTTEAGLSRLQGKYGQCYKEITKKGNLYIIELNLDDIWSKFFSDKSFPRIKNEFYNQKFLKEDDIELTPQIKVSITIDKSSKEVLSVLRSIFEAICTSFAHFKYKGSFFTETDYKEQLKLRLDSSKYDIDKIMNFVLGTYSGYMTPNGVLESDSFLQRRNQGRGIEYQAFSTNYEAKFTQLLNIFAKLYENNGNMTANRYLTINDIPLKNHIRIGSLLEILDLGTFESTGGDDPKIFIRLNDPRRIEKDSTNIKYSNVILESVKNRHKVSCDIFEHFFTRYFSNDKRWDMIEDFFLGMSNDELFDKYPGGTTNHVNILDYLSQNKQDVVFNTDFVPSETSHNAELFKPKENGFYNGDSILTIGRYTKPVKKWVTDDPVSLHRIMTEYNINIEKEYYTVLMNRMQLNYFPYYRDFMGLKLLIKFPGYDSSVQASVPYKDNPVKFYKWWKSHLNEITLSYAEKIKLFLEVEKRDIKVLNKKHKALIDK